jgi:hypothetical protein
MGDRSGRKTVLCSLFIVLAVLAAGPARADEPNVRSLAAGIGFDNFSRTVVWSGDDAPSRLLGNALTARAEIGVGDTLVFSLFAGLSFSDFSGLTFDGLPIGLRFAGSSISGFALGFEAERSLKRLGDFEIGAAGRFVYNFGLSRTWPLEGFAVEGQATGQPNWLELAAGPRVAYLFFGRVVPYVEVTARLLWAGFRMTELLDDLEGREMKKVRGDFAVAVAMGADARVSSRLTVKGKAGILPYAGGVDTLFSVGVLYGF